MSSDDVTPQPAMMTPQSIVYNTMLLFLVAGSQALRRGVDLADNFTVILNPMEIRTFQITLNWTPSGARAGGIRKTRQGGPHATLSPWICVIDMLHIYINGSKASLSYFFPTCIDSGFFFMMYQVCMYQYLNFKSFLEISRLFVHMC